MKRSRSARSSRRRLPSFIDGILRSQMSERTYQTVQPKYVAACWILSRRASGEETCECTDTTSVDDNHIPCFPLLNSPIPYIRTAWSEWFPCSDPKYIIPQPQNRTPITPCLPSEPSSNRSWSSPDYLWTIFSKLPTVPLQRLSWYSR